MKHIGMILLVLGVALCAAFGSNLSPGVYDLTVAKGAQQLAPEAAEKATPDVPGPGVRLSGWSGGNLAPFLGGLFFVVIGSVIARVAVRKEAAAGGPAASSAGQSGPADFGAVLAQLREDVGALAEDLSKIEGTTGPEIGAIQGRIEELQRGPLVQLVDAGPQLQLRYGLAGFAGVFSPLSGAERRINRSWSALVDLHVPEAKDSLETAAAMLGQAADALGALKPVA